MRGRRRMYPVSIDAHQAIPKSTHISLHKPQTALHTRQVQLQNLSCLMYEHLNFKYNFNMWSDLCQAIKFVHKQLITTFAVFKHFNRQTAISLSIQLHQYYNVIIHIVLTKTCKFCTICITTDVRLLCPIFCCMF